MTRRNEIKPITYLKNKTADLVREVSEDHKTVIITQNGEAKVVVMDVDTYDRWQDALVILKLVAQGQADVAAGRVVSQSEALAAARPLARRRPRSL